MRALYIIFIYVYLFSFYAYSGNKETESPTSLKSINYPQAFLDTLTAMHDRTDNEYLKIHFNSIKEVISFHTTGSPRDTGYIRSMYGYFISKAVPLKATELSSYTGRRIPLIIAWKSPTDGKVSLSWLKLPANWDPEKEYPMYVDLHCDWDVAANPLRYMAYHFYLPDLYNEAFEDGYLVQPWGRGNEWFENIAETDVWDCIHKVQSIVKIDYTRMYLFGFSMGGCGTWKIAYKTPNYWAAIAMMSGALSMGGDIATTKYASVLKNVPAFFVVGTQDFFYKVNYTACKLLIEAGNKNTKFKAFSGGHETYYGEDNDVYLWLKKYRNDDFTEIEQSSFTKSGLSCYPNPVKNSCTIKYYVPANNMVIITITDLYGRIISMPVNSFKFSGSYQIQYNTEQLNSGVYLISLKCGSVISETRMVIVR